MVLNNCLDLRELELAICSFSSSSQMFDFERITQGPSRCRHLRLVCLGIRIYTSERVASLLLLILILAIHTCAIYFYPHCSDFTGSFITSSLILRATSIAKKLASSSLTFTSAWSPLLWLWVAQRALPSSLLQLRVAFVAFRNPPPLVYHRAAAEIWCLWIPSVIHLGVSSKEIIIKPQWSQERHLCTLTYPQQYPLGRVLIESSQRRAFHSWQWAVGSRCSALR